ncbi:Clp protease N-terminal domain-containing protein, partial [Rhodococcus jostii]|uniref:Clp protease N-terminal domain-containing protein n=1 Tax=Rhodococcus jostii TaxID=132919 RepID=UPI003638B3A6
ILIRAAEIANERGYNYLGDEHVVLAMLEDPLSGVTRAWDGALTAKELRERVLVDLPPRPADYLRPTSPVVVITDRVMPDDSH